MEEEQPDSATPAPEDGLPSPVAVAPDRGLLLEFGVVLAIAWLPNFHGAVSSLCWPESAPMSFARHNVSLLVWAVQTSAPLLYIMWRSGESLDHFGLTRPRWLVDVVLGVMVFVAEESVLRAAWSIAPVTDTPFGLASRPPTGAGEWMLFLAANYANAFTEELAMRGYLLVRLRQFFGSSAQAVLMTSFLFASYHIYQGMRAVADILLTGLIYGIAFCVVRRLWPVVIAHILANVYGVLLR